MMNLEIAFLAPLISAIICFSLQKVLSKKTTAFIATSCICLAAFCSLIVFIESIGINYKWYIRFFNWIKLDSLDVNLGLYIDNLGLIMYLVVCVISAAVHIYSIGYMWDDPGFNLFISYLAIFTFFMLMLVSAGNLLQTFFGWEGVGLCSYLLIGFWSEKEEANQASIKAFVVNRLADTALIIAILIIFNTYHSLTFEHILSNVDLLKNTKIGSFSLLNLTCLLICIAAMAKSAQLTLHTWLPDAMEGPTPVSALIHAATMVTAGIFLICKMHVLFANSNVSTFIAIIGAVTAVTGAMIGIFITDIKKIIAYSTISQLGYMFMACGLKAYHAAIFHLMCHAFYKASLFLTAGNIIHATNLQDMRLIGNVRTKMKITCGFFVIAALALIGVPPLSGFYSKDLILYYAYDNSFAIFLLAVIGSFCSTIYSIKIFKSVFINQSNNSNTKAHEAPAIMLMPIFALTFGTICLGWLGMEDLRINSASGYLSYNFTINPVHESPNAQYLIILTVILGSIIGYIYSNYCNKKPKNFVLNLLSNKFYFDELYQVLLVKPFLKLAKLISKFDAEVIDKLGPGNAIRLTQNFSEKVSKFHTGYIFTYSFGIIFSILLLTTYFMLGT